MELEKIKSVMLGHAVGDALGVPVEFCSREELLKKPVKNMMGYGTYPYPAGCWSDDTSMSLCALDVLAKGYCDFDEIMVNFGKWYYKDEYTPTGEMFDVGNTCSYAIDNYFANKMTVDNCGLDNEYSNGNGSLMRIHPFVLYIASQHNSLTDEDMELIFKAPALTHAHIRSKIGCGIYACVLMELLISPSADSIYKGLEKAKIRFEKEPKFAKYNRIFENTFSEIPREAIKSGGYIVDTLEAAIWCLMTTHSYKECVLKAVNLGDDTDTVAAVAGGLAGALYGYESIPKEWLSQLKKKDYIEGLCETAKNAWDRLPYEFEMTDLHTHIVPGVDDGSKNLEMSLKMLRMAQNQGIKTVYCTSHNSDCVEIVQSYERQFNELKRIASSKFPDMRIYCGTEIFGFEEDVEFIISDIKNGTYKTLGNTMYVLIEFSIDETECAIENTLMGLIRAGYVPIIAHAERYKAFDDNSLVERLISKGSCIQINAYSIVEETNMEIKLRARTLLFNKQVDFLGTDAHTLRHRPPRVTEGLRYIYAMLDCDYANEICYKNALNISNH